MDFIAKVVRCLQDTAMSCVSLSPRLTDIFLDEYSGKDPETMRIYLAMMFPECQVSMPFGMCGGGSTTSTTPHISSSFDVTAKDSSLRTVTIESMKNPSPYVLLTFSANSQYKKTITRFAMHDSDSQTIDNDFDLTRVLSSADVVRGFSERYRNMILNFYKYLVERPHSETWQPFVGRGEDHNLPHGCSLITDLSHLFGTAVASKLTYYPDTKSYMYVDESRDLVVDFKITNDNRFVDEYVLEGHTVSLTAIRVPDVVLEFFAIVSNGIIVNTIATLEGLFGILLELDTERGNLLRLLRIFTKNTTFTSEVTSIRIPAVDWFDSVHLTTSDRDYTIKVKDGNVSVLAGWYRGRTGYSCGYAMQVLECVLGQPTTHADVLEYLNVEDYSLFRQSMNSAISVDALFRRTLLKMIPQAVYEKTDMTTSRDRMFFFQLDGLTNVVVCKKTTLNCGVITVHTSGRCLISPTLQTLDHRGINVALHSLVDDIITLKDDNIDGLRTCLEYIKEGNVEPLRAVGSQLTMVESHIRDIVMLKRMVDNTLKRRMAIFESLKDAVFK